ncbi:MAG TPA: hypothetical protein ENI61_00750 [Ignavibacteria bacterium]|nr:hypothetical protein [Ignavibacteria bacterium]
MENKISLSINSLISSIYGGLITGFGTILLIGLNNDINKISPIGIAGILALNILIWFLFLIILNLIHNQNGK